MDLKSVLSREPIDMKSKVADAVSRLGINGVLERVRRVLRGLDEVVLDVLSGLLVGRHVLLVGPVGMGKTTLAEVIAEALALGDPPYIEVACHSHMTATELIGDIDVVVALQAGLDHPLALIPGPLLMAHGRILILDEINRLNPYSQAALLQAMQEHYVYIRGFRIRTDFLTIATANPSEYSGVYELSEALADRFKVIHVPYPSKDLLKSIISWKASEELANLDGSVPDLFAEIAATFLDILSRDPRIDVKPSIRSMIYGVASAISRAWLERRNPSITDLKRSLITNLAGVVRGEFQSDEEKLNYLAARFDEAFRTVAARLKR